MPAGRPTKYKPTLVKKVDEYLCLCIDEEGERLKGVTARGTEMYEPKLTVKLPTIEGLALFLDVNQDTLREWASKHEEFSVALAKLMAKQKERLVSKGLTGEYNSTIAKLMLSSNHGMVERKDVTTGGQSINPSESDKAKSKNAINDFIGKNPV